MTQRRPATTLRIALFLAWTLAAGILSLSLSYLAMGQLRQFLGWPSGRTALIAWLAAACVVMLPAQTIGAAILRLGITRDEDGRLVVAVRDQGAVK
jgi:hypothetical protein